MKLHKPADYIASIDPGKWACGLAVWSLDKGQLVHASWVRNPWKNEPGQERPEIWGDTARQVTAMLAHRWQPYGQVNLVLEIPQVYEKASEKDKNDLIDLAGVQGAIVGGFPQGFVEWSPKPAEWKGQLPKEVSEKRVDSKLTAAEKALIDWPAESYRHNVYDAIHLGIVYLEREGLRDFAK